jgi:hypothetical protein
MSIPVVSENTRPAVGLGRLVATFLVVGATSFGDGLTGYLRRRLVEELFPNRTKPKRPQRET